MATVTIPAQVQVTDDMTGKVLTADDKAVKVEITMKVDGKTVNGGKALTLDMAAAAAAHFAEFVSDPSDENRRAFGAIVPRPKVGASASGTAKDADASGTSKRDWLKSAGLMPADQARGKFTAEHEDAWSKHLADEKAAADEKTAA